MAFTPATALDYLRRAREHDRLGHAYLISGAQGSGKRKLAANIAQLVNGTPADEEFRADGRAVSLIEPESRSRRIVIDQIRELEHALQLRTGAGKKKIAIISDADRLVPQAANAFLKTLEEPPNDSLLLLLSSLPEALPDTILSRCVPIPLALPPAAALSSEERELLDLLAAAVDATGSGVQLPYTLAQGFQRLLATIRASIQEESAAALKQDELRYKNTTDGSWLDEREDYYKARGESLYVGRRARLLDTLLLWWAEILRAKTEVARSDLPTVRETSAIIASKLSTADILRRVRRVEELRDHLGRNIQETLAIEVAFLSVFAL